MPQTAPPIEGRFVDWMERLADGKETLPNCDGEKHHYVPQFLLRRFRGGGKLYELDKETGEIKETTTKEAAWHKDLYKVVSTTGEHDGLIEAFFALSENFAKEAIECLVRDGAALNGRDRGDLAFLAAIQEQRAPGYLDEFKVSIRQTGITQTAVTLANIKGKKRQQALEAYESIVTGKVLVEPHDQEVLRLAIESLSVTSQVVNALPWTILKAKPGSLFVCSDRPLTMRDPMPAYPFSSPAWESSPMVWSTLPLGRDLCLRIGPNESQRTSLKEVRNLVDVINLRTYGWATRYVYGPSPEILEALHSRAEEAPKPMRKRLVMTEDFDKADPAVVERNIARGWPPFIEMADEQGNVKKLSYEVIDTDDDARRSMSPRTPAPLAAD